MAMAASIGIFIDEHLNMMKSNYRRTVNFLFNQLGG